MMMLQGLWRVLNDVPAFVIIIVPLAIWIRAFRCLLTVLLFHFFVQKSDAAEIARHSPGNLQVDGLIELGDQAKFEAEAIASDNAIVVLNSPGGNVKAALEMGRIIRRKGFATEVPEDTLCASACSLMWLAGRPRRSGARAHIGFHATSKVEAGERVVSLGGNALVGAYLGELGLSEDAIIWVMDAPPEKIVELDPSMAQSIGLDVVWLQQGSGLPPPSETYDPISVVRRFYRALSAADGDMAAALVVPEKRGVGPFNETNIANFFGNMKEPLRLLSVRQLGPDLVLAEYRYVHANGKVCNAESRVTTTYAFKKTLIQGIKANC